MSRKRKILVVDDQFLLALEIADIIEDQGHEVLGPYSTVDQALSHVERDPPDTAILDINMGEGQTTEPIARALKERNVPFAFLTGYNSADMLSDIFSDIEKLAKPALSDEISGLIDRLLFGIHPEME